MNQPKTSKAEATASSPRWRISIKGAGDILDAFGNPINSHQKEFAVKAVNEYDALNAVAEAAEFGHVENCATMHCHLCQRLSALAALRAKEGK